MWSINSRHPNIKGNQIEVFNIFNGYKNSDSNIFQFNIKAGKISRVHDFALVK